MSGDPFETRDPDEDATRVRLAAARRTDPTADEPSLRRFWHEISQAEAELDAIDAVAPLPVAFTATWPEQDHP